MSEQTVHLADLRRNEEFGRVIAHRVDQPRDRVGRHLVGRVWGQESSEVFRPRRVIEPGVFVLAFQNCGHPIVDWLDQFVWFGCDDRERTDFLSLGVLPHVPQSSEGKRLLGRQRDVHGRFGGLLGIDWIGFPLEKAVGRDQTPLALERPPVGRELGDGLGPCVHHLVPEFGVFGPGWNQPPAVEIQQPLAVRQNDRRRLTGREIEAWPEFFESRSEPKPVLQLVQFLLLGIPVTHVVRTPGTGV